MVWPSGKVMVSSRLRPRLTDQLVHNEGGSAVPRINIRYDSGLVDGKRLAGTMQDLAEMGARHYFTTPDQVVVELFEQSQFTIGHRTIDIEINALPDREGRRAPEIERFALDMTNYFAKWMHSNGVDGTVGVETRIFATGAFAWTTAGSEAVLSHSSLQP
jgi:hypothetical protein